MPAQYKEEESEFYKSLLRTAICENVSGDSSKIFEQMMKIVKGQDLKVLVTDTAGVQELLDSRETIVNFFRNMN